MSASFDKSSDKQPGFLPWSIPAALCLSAGIVLARVAPLSLVVLLTLIGMLLLLLTRLPRWTLILTLLIPVGYLRYDSWQQQTNPLEALLDSSVTVSGWSDGRYFVLDDPANTRVVLSPKGVVGAGRATLTGSLFEAAGKRNPGGFDYAGYLRRRGVWGQLIVQDVVAFTPARFNLKERLRRGVTVHLSAQAAALMQAMTLGVRDDLGDLRDIFSASGLAHILALSGLHVGILVTALGVALKPLGLRRYPVLIVLVLGFMLLVGITPSILRAGAMVIAVLVSLWLGRGRIEPWPSLALAALITLVWNPSWLFDLSFQLSYLAVIGILAFTPPLLTLFLGKQHHVLPWWHPKVFVIGSMVVSSSAQLLSLPLVASTFGSVPLFSPVVNVLAVPVASVLVPLGFLAGVLGALLLPLAWLVNTFTGILAGFLIFLANAASHLPSLTWGEVSWLGYAYYAVFCCAALLALYQQIRPWQSLLIISTAMLCSMLSVPEHSTPEVIFLDVGQGDSVLIRLPGRNEILIDAGGSPFSDYDVGTNIVYPALKALGIDELELVIATHTDTDHVEGLYSLLDVMPVRQLLIGTPKAGDPVFDKLIVAAERNNVRVTPIVRGESVSLGPVKLEFLNPPRDAFDADNDNSVVTLLFYEGLAKALFLGDSSFAVEAELAVPDVQILMAGHHGSGSSTSEALLTAAQAEHVVLSYGRNTYGHPHPDVLARISATGANLYETHHDGAVRLSLLE